ncbi:MAG TPA: NAD(P)H-binding protein [Stackebrandtia sp.]|jgi:uncharacterized protein YbjT (DUF2867 family)|uniref:SDR family oxidoreductase n=1 Tax=Stackebrandtia sp. TaxID=2023065 RepID=UPI002D61C27D|nr:NAD(P)H-binding protein [Stackebrandtia sp.]HZE38240.1 NAD(P)H-binding protein [Stackebrandtia sp.]
MIAITGATGNVGRALVRRLAATDAAVTATSRSISAADVPDNVRWLRSDLAEPASLRPVLDGARALFLHNGGASAAAMRTAEILSAAAEAGVERVVLLSSLGVKTRPETVSHGQIGRSIEEAVVDSGIDWTILRPVGFATNTLAWAASIREGRGVAAPFGDVATPIVDPDDIAAVAAAVLAESGHSQRFYELTGPELVSPRQQAAAIAAALGEPIAFVEQTRQEAREVMLNFMPEAITDSALEAMGRPTAAELAVSPDVPNVLKRPAGTFADWAGRNAAAFR